MQWATQRQLMIAAGIAVFLALIAVGAWFLFFYKAPSCGDGLMNQNEEGIDCGGTCALLCQAPRVSPVWARSVKIAPGVYHAVALVRNPLADAATDDLPYLVQLFDAKGILIAEFRGRIALGPGEVAPLFQAGIRTGERVPARTLAEFGIGSWRREERTDSPFRVTPHDTPATVAESLRLSATVENATALPLGETAVTALLYDASGTLVTASQTVVDGIPGRGRADVVFSLQYPFCALPVRLDIIPRLSQ